MLEYQITATVQQGGQAQAIANHSELAFDATSGRDDKLPNPAELLLTSLAACILKNVQRYSEMLNIPYRKAQVTVRGTRTDNPPIMSEINYKLEIDTDADERQIATLHKNILKFGTITNTLNKACKLSGTISKLNN